MIIPKGTFLNMEEDAIVGVLYPNTQVNVFPYIHPSNKGVIIGYDSIGYIVSTIFNKKLFYEYVNLSDHPSINVEKILESMRNNIKSSVMKTI